MSSPYARWRELQIRHSLRRRLVTLILGFTVLTIAIIMSLGYTSVQDLGNTAVEMSSNALRQQAEEYLVQTTLGDVQRNDLVLKSVQQNALDIAQFTANAFSQGDQLQGNAFWSADDQLFTGSDGQTVNSETELTSVFVPNFVEIDQQVQAELELSAYLELILPTTFESDDNTVAIYMGSEQNITRYYPNIGLGNLLPPDWQVTQRPWYVQARPDNNPGRDVIWTPVYQDATGKGMLVTAAAPIFVRQDEFVGVIGVDITLNRISTNIENTRLTGNGYSFLIDSDGYAIALPRQGYRDILGRNPGVEDSLVNLNDSENAFAPVIANMTDGDSGFETLKIGNEGRELYVAYAPLETTGWSLANVSEAETILQFAATLETEMTDTTRNLILRRLLPVSGAILIVIIIAASYFANRETEPLRRMAEAAQRIGSGDWDAPLPPTTQDEVGVLSQALTRMVQQLRNLMRDLENQVRERTADLAQRSNQLEAAAFVAREAAGIQDQEMLLNQTVELISNRFNFYHAGIFLLDEAGDFAVLRAASSDGGKQMLARRHQLRIGETGIVGYVASTGKSRIALDVGEDATYFDNPDLPKTRSEMALPLMVHDQVIGVLDVQSTEAGAFTEDDVAILQTLADQVALAIENARLLDESRDRIREIDSLLSRFGHQSWQNTAAQKEHWGYLYDGIQVRAAESNGNQTESPQLKLPLRLRDEVIGYLGLSMNERKPTPDEVALAEAVANQASLALESAWLYTETQRRAMRDQLTTQVASQLRGSLDIDTILQTAVREIGQLLELAEVEVRVGADLVSSEFSQEREQ